MFFRPNGSFKSYKVSTLEDVKKILGEKANGFSNIEIDKERKLVLGNINNDPLYIAIGKLEEK